MIVATDNLFEITIDEDIDFIQIEKWLEKEVGKRKVIWLIIGHWSGYAHDTWTFGFKYEEDKIKFILRWL